MAFLQKSVSASVLILAILFVRRIALYRLPKKVFPVLWGAALCRLLIPAELPFRFSFLSVLSMLRGTADAAEAGSYAGAPSPVSAVFQKLALPQGDPGSGTGLPDPAAGVSPAVILYAAGAVGCALFFLLPWLAALQRFKTARPAGDNFVRQWQQTCRHRIPVMVICDRQVRSALTYGLFRPVILLPEDTNWADRETLRYVLTHEAIHVRRKDTLYKSVLTAALCLHWFNPLVWCMALTAGRDLELACDEAVLLECGVSRKYEYSLALLRSEKAKNGFCPVFSSFSGNAIRERLCAIMKTKKRTVSSAVSAILVAAAVIIFFATSGTGVPHAAASGERSSAEAAADSEADPSVSVSSAAAGDPADKPSSEVQTAVLCFPAGTGCRGISRLFSADHSGIDIYGSRGTPILSAAAGTVTEAHAADDGDDGLYIVIDSGSLEIKYCHCSSLAVSAGDTVAQGQTIAAMGSSGKSNGNHLFFQILVNGTAADPAPYLGLA